MKEQLLTIINHPRRNIVVAGVASFAGGAGLGYFLGRRKATSYGVHEVPDTQLTLDLDHDDDVGVDISRPDAPVVIEAEAYEEINQRGPVGAQGTDSITREEIVETVEELLENVKFREVSINFEGDGKIHALDPHDDEEPEVIRQTVFAANDDDGWDYAEELLARAADREHPYVIHRDEFFDQENDYAQVTLTYFEGDNIMCDEEEIPVYNYQIVVGELKFGHGSGDKNVFYVRNDKRQAEYEILRHEGQFLVEVGGADPNQSERARGLQHSNTKFRMD